MSLIHIPLHSYAFFLHSVLKLLFPLKAETATPAAAGGAANSWHASWASRHQFLNVSITPVECSVVCSTALAQELFVTVNDEQSRTSRGTGEMSISTEDYVVVQVDGEGLDAGQRVLELTTPLAMAGMWAALPFLSSPDSTDIW